MVTDDAQIYARCRGLSNGLSLDKAGFWSILKEEILRKIRQANPSI
jgi:hypothetical protein